MSHYRKRIVRTPQRVRKLYTFKEFSRRNQSFSVPALRSLRFKSKPRSSSLGAIREGFMDAAFVKVGARVYIDEHLFFHLLRQQRTKGPTNSTLTEHKGRRS